MTPWRWAIIRRERQVAATQLPLAVDLLAAALRSGAAPEVAVTAVGEAFPGALGDRLTRVSRALRVGLPPREAWERMADIPGAGPLVRAAVFSADNGTALAHALDRLGNDLRMVCEMEAETSARRVGVLGVIPLGLCFLPAFLLMGVAPLVMAVIRDLTV